MTLHTNAKSRNSFEEYFLPLALFLALFVVFGKFAAHSQFFPHTGKAITDYVYVDGRVVDAWQVQNMRLPGQYADAESGFSQNGFRDYVPQWGRYLESDPIGLAGGINTFAYVSGKPTRYTDRLGLEKCREEECSTYKTRVKLALIMPSLLVECSTVI